MLGDLANKNFHQNLSVFKWQDIYWQMNQHDFIILKAISDKYTEKFLIKIPCFPTDVLAILLVLPPTAKRFISFNYKGAQAILSLLNLVWSSLKLSEIYLRKMRPNTMCLYSAASILLRSLSAVAQSVFSRSLTIGYNDVLFLVYNRFKVSRVVGNS